MKPASFLLICCANALNPETKKRKIQYLSDLLVDQTRSENDDSELQERIENTVAKLISGLDTVNYNACNAEFDTDEKDVEYEYAVSEDNTVICDLADRVPMKIRSWVRHFGCKEAFEKKYVKKMRKQAARLKNLAEEAGNCNCIDPCAELTNSGSCLTVINSCAQELDSALTFESHLIEPVLKIKLEFECQSRGLRNIFRATSNSSGKKLLEVKYEIKDGERSVLVTNESLDYRFTCSPGDWHSIELEHQFVCSSTTLLSYFSREKTGFRTSDFTLREEWIKIDGIIKRVNLQFLNQFSSAISYVGDEVVLDFMPDVMTSQLRNVYAHTFDDTV